MSIVGNMSTGCKILNNNGNLLKFGLQYSTDTDFNSIFRKFFEKVVQLWQNEVFGLFN